MDSEAFRAMTDPLRRELQLHCYRMLGSLHDAEDMLQETLLAAWNGIAQFEGRSSLRTWLYRIATNQCLNARRAEGRRPAKAWDVPGVDPPEPTRLGEVVWLEPYPDALLERRESIALAFIAALQTLPPRQLAVLVLRDIVGFEASEVAAMMDTTVDAANSSLKRARQALETTRPSREVSPARETELLAKFVAAWESADVARLVSVLTDDVLAAMPPIPFEYVGRDVVAQFCTSIFRAGRRFTLIPTRANGQPAFGAYLLDGNGAGHGVGLFVLEVRDEGISALMRFENELLAKFGLPRVAG